ncbi:MAG: hypothetical protein ACRD40_14125 [Candidatus Acidiferrales bacterium]
MKSTRHVVMGMFVALILAILQTGTALADQVVVHYPEGAAHGLFVVRSLNGKEIGKGELTETINGGRVSAKLTLSFNNGSLYEETTRFTQGGVFRVLDYHLVQSGPSFKQAIEMTIDAGKGVVAVRCNGGQAASCKDHVWTKHLQIPPDLANGIVPFLVRNVSPKTDRVQVSMIVATPKPRLVHVSISPTALQTFPFQGSKLEATRYALTVDPGGMLGPLVKMTGRQPPPSFVWMLHDKVPSFLMAQQSFIDGPVCRIELASSNASSDDSAQGSGS